MKHLLAISVLCVGLSGCAATLPWSKRPVPEPVAAAPTAQSVTTAPVPTQSARTVEQFDTTSAQERAAAMAPAETPPQATALGLTVASLGSPAEPGFWLKTPLVSEQGPGRVVYPATGRAVEVTLIPIKGPPTAGSRMSLAALRLIGAPLTGLPQVQVFAIR